MNNSPYSKEIELELSLLFEELKPMAKRRVAVFIGRFQPPTKGHYEVINEIKKFIRTHKELNLETTPIVIIIGGNKSDLDKARNPLSISEREAFMTASGRADGVKFISAPNAFAGLAKLRELGFEPIAVAGGSDRDDYKDILDKYFFDSSEKPIKHYSINVERDEDSIETDKNKKLKSIDLALKQLNKKDLETDKISGSLARRAVELDFEPEFAKIVGLEDKPKLAKKMFDKISKSMKQDS